jgi:hypothetical protein
LAWSSCSQPHFQQNLDSAPTDEPQRWQVAHDFAVGQPQELQKAASIATDLPQFGQRWL